MHDDFLKILAQARTRKRWVMWYCENVFETCPGRGGWMIRLAKSMEFDKQHQSGSKEDTFTPRPVLFPHPSLGVCHRIGATMKVLAVVLLLVVVGIAACEGKKPVPEVPGPCPIGPEPLPKPRPPWFPPPEPQPHEPEPYEPEPHEPEPHEPEPYEPEPQPKPQPKPKPEPEPEPEPKPKPEPEPKPKPEPEPKPKPVPVPTSPEKRVPEEPPAEKPVEPAGPSPCPTAPDTSCHAYSALKIDVTGGSCSGEVKSSCSALSTAINDIDKSVKNWFSDDEKLCDEGAAEASAEAVATAIARVYAEAFAKVTCEGEGYACGWSLSGGKAWAVAFAEAIAQAAAGASSQLSDSSADSLCYADLRALSVVFAQSTVKSQAEACTRGGTKESFKASLANTINKGIATAYGNAKASACGEKGSKAETKCTGKAGSKSEGTKVAYGDACGGLEQVKACKGPGASQCCKADFTSSFCSCGDECDGPWQRIKEADRDGAAKRTWKDRSGGLCFCSKLTSSTRKSRFG